MTPARWAPVGSRPQDLTVAAAESDGYAGCTVATCSQPVTGARGPGVGQWGLTEAPRGLPGHAGAKTTTGARVAALKRGKREPSPHVPTNNTPRCKGKRPRPSRALALG